MCLREWVWIVLPFILLTGCELIGQDHHGAQIRHSDIFISGQNSDKICKQFHVSGIAWGFLPNPLSDENMDKWRRSVEYAHSRDQKFQARIEFDAKWQNMIDYDPEGFTDHVMRTLDGNMLIIPWFSDRKYKGNPAYWFCSNSPKFREYLKYQADLALSGNPDKVMLDAQTASAAPLRWNAACFCDHCMEGFRKYLGSSYTIQELHGMGINDIFTFDYALFLRQKAYDQSSFLEESRNVLNRVPLLEEYRLYQLKEVNELCRELCQYIQKKAGWPIPVSTSSPPHQPYRAVYIPEISHYTLEMMYYASRHEIPFSTIRNIKIAEGIGKKLIVTAVPQFDWNIILEEDREGLVRTWIAQAYAYGANFIAPVRQWAGGHLVYRGKADDYVELYDFVHANADLLDGYESMAAINVLMEPTPLLEISSQLDSIVEYLTMANIPFKIIQKGEEIGPDPVFHELQDVIKATASGVGECPRPISVRGGNGKISILPRENDTCGSTPYICHVLNRDYDKDLDLVLPCGSVELMFSKSLLSEEIYAAVFYQPGKDPVELEMSQNESGLSIHLPEVAEWGIIAFHSPARIK